MIAPLLRRAFRWRGPLGPAFVSSLMGPTSVSLSSLVNPVAWALDMLGFAPGTVKPTKKDVTSRFRGKLREVHPDTGGDESLAAKVIFDLSEARRILAE
jgi:hypothetical protein